MMIREIRDYLRQNKLQIRNKTIVSYKAEVHTKYGWSTNSMRYSSEKEALEAGKELLSRWCILNDSRATASNDAVNAVFDFESYRSHLID